MPLAISLFRSFCRDLAISVPIHADTISISCSWLATGLSPSWWSKLSVIPKRTGPIWDRY
jgi:hypothetical protein